MDLLFGRYADHALADLTTAQLDEMEALIEVPDRDLFGWITGEMDVPPNYDSSVFRALRGFHMTI